MALLMRLRTAALATAIFVIPPSEAGAQALEAPYQVIEMLVDERSRDHHGIPGLAPVIDIDLASTPSQAQAEEWSEATLLSDYGPARASLSEIRRSCRYFCGVSGEEICHFQAVLDRHEDGPQPLAALPGTVELSDYEPLEPAPEVSELTWSTGFHAPIWPADQAGAIRIDGWDSWTRRLSYTVQTNSEEHSREEPGCRASAAAGLTMIQCHEVALIAADGVPLLLSRPEHSHPAAAPLARFMHNGELHILVKLGLEGQTVYGLLVKREGTWVPLLRKAERRLMC